ncbi:MAG: hypothetical protein FWD49_03140 [Firmicutes bacterium]|nr:hypothetical protein [Bacillota bacterium]
MGRICITVGATHGTSDKGETATPNKTPPLPAFGRKGRGIFIYAHSLMPRATLTLAQGYAHCAPLGL